MDPSCSKLYLVWLRSNLTDVGLPTSVSRHPVINRRDHPQRAKLTWLPRLRDPASRPEVTHQSSVPCHPQTPWVRWVNENAFAFIVQARPCPTFGRPVHRRGSPHRLRPGTSPHTLRIPPHDGHPVLRSPARSGFRFTLAVSSFRLRARLGFSIPLPFSGQRGITPAFGYNAPHPGAGRTSTLLNNALLSAHYAAVRLLGDVHAGRTA